jgi:hypothetical protein
MLSPRLNRPGSPLCSGFKSARTNPTLPEWREASRGRLGKMRQTNPTLPEWQRRSSVTGAVTATNEPIAERSPCTQQNDQTNPMAFWVKSVGYADCRRTQQNDQTNPMAFWVKSVGYADCRRTQQNDQTNPMAFWVKFAGYVDRRMRSKTTKRTQWYSGKSLPVTQATLFVPCVSRKAVIRLRPDPSSTIPRGRHRTASASRRGGRG